MTTILKKSLSSVQSHLAELQVALECSPLATEDYASAINHLKNAENYLAQGEHGAAQFEIKMLKAKLNQK